MIMKKFGCLLLIFQVSHGDECQDYVARHRLDFSPIRIHVEHNYDSKYDILREAVLPRVILFLQRSVSVRPHLGPLRFPRPCRRSRNGVCIETALLKCGGNLVPDFLLESARMNSEVFPSGAGVDADLVVFVSVKSDIGNIRAEAGVCLNRDLCGRPLAGMLNIGSDVVLSAANSSLSMDIAVSTLIHEFFHILAFSQLSFSYFRDPETMEPRVPLGSSIYYKCSKDAKDKYSVDWDVPKSAGVHEFRFVAQVVQPLSVRGLIADDCPCPTNPNRKYTNREIEDCLRHSNKCALAVVTPKVAAAAQSYFGCPDAKGMELENAFGISCSRIHQSHWKNRLVSGELMTATNADRAQYISPMSFALLEDSGWYMTNRDMVSGFKNKIKNSVGMFWGYHEGCHFLHDKCSSNKKIVAGQFCLAEQKKTMTCSPSRRQVLMCTDGDWRSGIEKKTILKPYHYGDTYAHGQKHMDYCPAFEPYQNSDCGHSSRCLFVGSRHACTDVVCQGTDFYEVNVNGVLASEKCVRENQIVYVIRNRTKFDITCGDPSIVCAEWNFPHLAYFSGPSKHLPTKAVRTLKDTPENLGTKSVLHAIGITSLIVQILMS